MKPYWSLFCKNCCWLLLALSSVQISRYSDSVWSSAYFSKTHFIYKDFDWPLITTSLFILPLDTHRSLEALFISDWCMLLFKSVWQCPTYKCKTASTDLKCYASCISKLFVCYKTTFGQKTYLQQTNIFVLHSQFPINQHLRIFLPSESKNTFTLTSSFCHRKEKREGIQCLGTTLHPISWDVNHGFTRMCCTILSISHGTHTTQYKIYKVNFWLQSISKVQHSHLFAPISQAPFHI